jgi:hypothetical protein
VNLYGDTTPIIFNANGTIFLNSDHNFGAAASHGFINAIVGDFIDQMVQSPLVGAANIHTRSPAYGFPPAQDLDIPGGVSIIQ